MPAQKTVSKVSITLRSKIRLVKLGKKEDYQFYLRQEKKHLKKFFDNVSETGVVHLA